MQRSVAKQKPVHMHRFRGFGVRPLAGRQRVNVSIIIAVKSIVSIWSEIRMVRYPDSYKFGIVANICDFFCQKKGRMAKKKVDWSIEDCECSCNEINSELIL